jgi:hypothetical protein
MEKSQITNEQIIRKDGVFVTYTSPDVVQDSLYFHITDPTSPLGTIIAGTKSTQSFIGNGVITGYSLLADQSGDLVIDLWKDTYANYPPTNADTITGGNEPTLSSSDKSADTTLTDWTTTFTLGDILMLNVDSASSVVWADLNLGIKYDLELNEIIFTAYYAMEILEVSEVHTQAGTDGSAVTLNLERLQGTEAPGAGDAILSSEFDLKGTANTVQTRKGVDFTDARLLSPGDRIALSPTGTLTSVEGVQVTLYLKFFGRGDYY